MPVAPAPNAPIAAWEKVAIARSAVSTQNCGSAYFEVIVCSRG
ncbi:hypothetical protein ROT00_08150 [Agromyces mediolanus]